MPFSQVAPRYIKVMKTTGRPQTLFVSIGQRIGNGVVINPEVRLRANKKNPKGVRAATLRCDCGNEYTVALSSLVERKGVINTTSCGCVARELTRQRRGALHGNFVHGLYEHPLYPGWKGMLARCEDQHHQDYRLYGARGIKVCDRWHDVRLFIGDILRDLGPRPEGKSLDRVNNDGNYEPGNVRWATASEQNLNQRRRKADVSA